MLLGVCLGGCVGKQGVVCDSTIDITIGVAGKYECICGAMLVYYTK